jgi:hypothetical protein
MPQADDSVAYFPSLFVCRHGSPDLPGPPFQAFPGPSCIIFLAVVSFRRKKSAATPIPSYLCIQIGFDKLLYSHLCTNLTIKTDHDCGEFLHRMVATVFHQCIDASGPSCASCQSRSRRPKAVAW